MRRSLQIAAWSVAALSLAAGCELDLERMIEQPRYEAYEFCDVFTDKTIMQTPPEGTVPRSRRLLPEAVASGVGDGGFVREVPIEVDRAVLRRGRDRFDIFCAACHGALGDGVSQVAENMTLVEPPNLLRAPIRDYPAGQVYAVIRHGFGLMPSYAAELAVMDRWAVVAYLEALQLSQRAALEKLPPEMREEAEAWLTE